jgi:hypothetical protein
MALKWKYSQFRASICFDHSGGRPSMGQTFLAFCFSAQPPMAMTIRAKWNIGSEYLGIATRVCSQASATKGKLRIRRGIFFYNSLVNAVTGEVSSIIGAILPDAFCCFANNSVLLSSWPSSQEWCTEAIRAEKLLRIANATNGVRRSTR